MATTAVPVSEYLGQMFHPDREYVHGEIRERNLGEKEHSALQGFFTIWFGTRRDQLQIDCWPEQRVQVTSDNYRVPDVCVTRRSDRFEHIIERPPVLCIEILSPLDRLVEVREKVQDYARFGVPVCWVVDPYNRKAYTMQGGRFDEVSGDALQAGEVSIPLADVWAELDR